MGRERTMGRAPGGDGVRAPVWTTGGPGSILAPGRPGARLRGQEPADPHPDRENSAFGLGAQAGVAWIPTSHFGIGLTGVGEFNDLESLAAVTLSVHLGDLR